MKTRTRLRKGTALVISAALILSLAPMLPGAGTKSHAEVTATAESPSIWTYASKAKLKDDTFAPIYLESGTFDKDNTNIGLLQLGKNADGEVQKWFLLGPDTGISGDNAAIFAASDIMQGVRFVKNIPTSWDGYYLPSASLPSGGDYSGGDAKTYSGSAKIVGYNHYGISNAREQLQKIASNTNYFRADEQGILNKTKIWTYDYVDHIEEIEVPGEPLYKYSTDDKLYLASSDEFKDDGVDNIFIGASATYLEADNIKLNWETYCCYFENIDYSDLTNIQFWLRSECPVSDRSSWYAGSCNWVKGYGVEGQSIGYSKGEAVQGRLRPASNINLSHVLFASAAVASQASGYGEVSLITNNPKDVTNKAVAAAMTLRLDGSGYNIGSVEPSADCKSLDITRGSTKKTVSLVVQGRDSEAGDWYYSKKIDESCNIKDSAILDELNSLSVSTVDLTKCEIWLEVSDDSASSIAYAVQPAHMHDFSVKNTTEANLASAATCTSPAKYYYVCSCGASAKGIDETKTYEVGDVLGHHYAEDDKGNKVYTRDPNQHWYQCDRTPCSDLDGSITAEGGKIDHTFDQEVK